MDQARFLSILGAGEQQSSRLLEGGGRESLSGAPALASDARSYHRGLLQSSNGRMDRSDTKGPGGCSKLAKWRALRLHAFAL
jgi:hypothetical protein